MQSIRLTPLIVGLILTILICSGIWIYTEWDLKQFNESLPELPTVEASREGPAHPQSGLRQASTDTAESARGDISQLETDRLRVENENGEMAESATVVETQNAADVAFDRVSADYSDETAVGQLLQRDTTDVNPELPYDREIVKKGFDDYNDSLATNPEYAYQRLDDALREQFGDDPDVDILVEHTRRTNNGTTTLDSIIRNLEAQLRLLVKNNYPGQQKLQDAFQFYRTTKQMVLETGVEIKITGQAIIDTSRD